MGGAAFPDFYMPRMSPGLWKEICERTTKILRRHYRIVVVPPCAPGKTDFGDVDIVVGEPLGSVSRDDISKSFFALEQKGKAPTMHFALPFPIDINKLADLKLDDSDRRPTAVQVDVHQVEDPEALEWTVFFQSYGDLWAILGSIIRPYGLTATPEGLFLRIEELEDAASKNLLACGREGIRVKLTHDPDHALRFLSLDKKAEKGSWAKLRFKTPEDLYDFTSRCRFFDPQRKMASDVNQDQHKSDFRKRSRFMFNQWYEDYMPRKALAKVRSGPDARLDRKEAKGLVLAEFPAAEAEYEVKKQAGQRATQERMFWRDIRWEIVAVSKINPESSEGKGRISSIVNGFKREVTSTPKAELHKVGKPPAQSSIPAEMKGVQAKYKAGDFDSLVEYVTSNWKRIEARSKEHGMKKFREHLKNQERGDNKDDPAQRRQESSSASDSDMQMTGYACDPAPAKLKQPFAGSTAVRKISSSASSPSAERRNVGTSKKLEKRDSGVGAKRTNTIESSSSRKTVSKW